MKKSLTGLLVILGLVSSSVVIAEGVKLKDLEASTTVQGAVLHGAWGDNNEVNSNIGGVQGNVESTGKVKLDTHVNGAVTNLVKGDKNKSNLNVGGITSH